MSPRNLETKSKAKLHASTYKPETRKGWLQILAVVGVAALAFIIGTALFTAIPTGGGGTPPAQVFGLNPIDGMSGKTLPDNVIQYTIYGTDDKDDFSAFDSLVSGTDLSNIDESDLDTDYTYFIIRFRADAVAHSSALFVKDQGTRIFYERWAEIYRGIPNTLVLYEKFNLVAGIVWDSVNMAVISNISTVGAYQNITMLVQGNSTQTNAMYIAGKNYANEEDDSPSIIVTFNGSISLSDFNIAGTTKTRVNSTAIKYEFYQITASPALFNGIWNTDAASSLGVKRVQVLYGQNYLFRFAH